MRTNTARFLSAWGAVAVVLAVTVPIGGCDSQKSSPTPTAAPARPQPPVATPQTIRSFVMPLYAEGVPYDEARAFGTAAVPELVRLLDEPSMVDARSNIVVTLGMIGGDTAEAELRKVVEQGTGKLSPPEFSLRLDAQMSLGYAANIAANTTTLGYLIAALQAGVGNSRVLWQTPEGEVPFPRLRQRTAIALGLSGKPQAKAALEELLANGGGAGGRGGSHQLTPGDRAVIAEAIRANEYLATHSLGQYFKEYR